MSHSSQKRINDVRALFIVVNNNEYMTVYEQKGFIFLKIHSIRTTTNKLEYTTNLRNKFGPPNKDKFWDIFLFENNHLLYTEIAQDINKRKINTRSMKDLIKAIIKIQRMIRRYLLKRELHIVNYKMRLKIFITKAQIINNIAYKVRVYKENQKLIISMSQLNHCSKQNIISFKQQISDEYEDYDLISAIQYMTKCLSISKYKQQYKVQSISLEQAMSETSIYQLRPDPLLYKKQALSKQLQQQYIQHTIQMFDIQYDFGQISQIRIIQNWYRRAKRKYRKAQYDIEYGRQLNPSINYDIPNEEKQTKPEVKQMLQIYSYRTEFQFLSYYYHKIYDQIIIKVNNKGIHQDYKLNIKDFKTPYLSDLQDWSNLKILKVMTPILKIFNAKLIKRFQIDKVNLRKCVIECYTCRIQQYYHVHRFKQKIIQSTLNTFIGVRYHKLSVRFHKLVYRIQGSYIKIIHNRIIYSIHLLDIKSSDHIQWHFKDKLHIFDTLLNNEDKDIFYCRQIVDILDNLIQFKDKKIQFKIKITIKESHLKANIKYKSNILEYIIKIQRWYRLHYNKQRFLLKSKLKHKVYKHRMIKKINSSYYIIYVNIVDKNYVFTLVQYKSFAKYKAYYRMNEANILNIGQNSIIDFLIKRLNIIDGKPQFIMQNITSIQAKPKKTRINKFNISNRLIDVYQSNNQIYNVIYSQKRLNKTENCLKVDLSVRKARSYYHSDNILKTLGSSCIRSISYDDEQVKIDTTILQPEYLKITQKPKIQLARSIIQKKQKQLLCKTTVRFKNQKYLIQINYAHNPIKKIIPDSLDFVFQDYEQEFIISSINLDTLKELLWNLPVDQATLITHQIHKEQIAQKLLSRMYILENRFLYLSSEQIDLQFKNVIFIQEKIVKMVQKFIRSRKYRNNYLKYKQTIARISHKKRILYTSSKLKSETAFICLIVDSKEFQIITLYAWETVNFKHFEKSLHIHNVSQLWIKDKIKVSHLLLNQIEYRDNQIIYIKPKPQHLYQRLQTI